MNNIEEQVNNNQSDNRTSSKIKPPPRLQIKYKREYAEYVEKLNKYKSMKS